MLDKPAKETTQSIQEHGAVARTRTENLSSTNALLYHWSYDGKESAGIDTPEQPQHSRLTVHREGMSRFELPLQPWQGRVLTANTTSPSYFLYRHFMTEDPPSGPSTKP